MILGFIVGLITGIVITIVAIAAVCWLLKGMDRVPHDVDWSYQRDKDFDFDNR